MFPIRIILLKHFISGVNDKSGNIRITFIFLHTLWHRESVEIVQILFIGNIPFGPLNQDKCLQV